MSKRFKYSIGIGIVFIVLALFSKPLFNVFVNTDTVANKIGCRIFEFNTISVKTDSQIDLNKVLIKTDERIVFKDGHQQNKIGQHYGHNILEVYVEDLLISETGHFRKNNWYTNQYAFEISKKGSNFIVKHQIDGPDAKNDNFQKRYVYDDLKNLVRIDYLNEQGQIYTTEKKGSNAN